MAGGFHSIDCESHGDPPDACFIRCSVLRVSRMDLLWLVTLRRFLTLLSLSGFSTLREDHDGHLLAVRRGARQWGIARQSMDILAGPSFTLFVLSPDSRPTVHPVALAGWCTFHQPLSFLRKNPCGWVTGGRSAYREQPRPACSGWRLLSRRHLWSAYPFAWDGPTVRSSHPPANAPRTVYAWWPAAGPLLASVLPTVHTRALGCPGWHPVTLCFALPVRGRRCLSLSPPGLSRLPLRAPILVFSQLFW